jgi:hypothetical protein
MCMITTYVWAQCGCPERDVPTKCQDEVDDPYHCPDVELKAKCLVTVAANSIQACQATEFVM